MNVNDFLPFALKLTESQEAAKKYADHFYELLSFIDPTEINESYKNAFENKDYANALSILANHFRNKPKPPVSELCAKASYNQQAADKYLEGKATIINVEWEFPNAEVDFLFNPTKINGPINHEWLWQFNRHPYWVSLANAYVATSDEKYPIRFKKELLKWIAQTYVPEKWNGPDSAWRTIECGIRLLGGWHVTFDGMRSSDNIDDLTLLLMIASMHRQSIHLKNNPTGKNWLMMEANGVYTFSALYPEFSDAKENRILAQSRIIEEIEKQILPDGMHNELSPDYQSVVFNCAANLLSLASGLGFSSEVPRKVTELIENTVRSAIQLSTPAFTQPRSNDTYTIRTSCFTDRAEKLLGKKPEYSFVNSRRAEGAPPQGQTPSVFLPYAGFAVMRNDWTENSAYLCFDVGPLGAAHVHQDKLNINIYKGSQELIYDDGGGQYEISPARNYAVSGYAHNIALVDGLAQTRNSPAEYKEPADVNWISNDQFDYAVASYTDEYGKERIKPATQTREVRFCKPGFFIVSDTMRSSDGNNHSYEILFHLDTTKVNSISDYTNAVISDYGKTYEIAIIPLDDESAPVSLKTVSAITEPQYQGWYNGRNENNLHKAITVSREVKDVKDFRFNTLLFPVKSGDTLPQITKTAQNTVQITFEGKSYTIDLCSLNK